MEPKLMNTKNPRTKELNEKLSMSIEDMLKAIDLGMFSLELIQLGYMQADCNEERMVDHDDAIRIFFEETIPHILDNMNQDSKMLFGTLVRIKTAPRWANEFPNNKATG